MQCLIPALILDVGKFLKMYFETKNTKILNLEEAYHVLDNRFRLKNKLLCFVKIKDIV